MRLLLLALCLSALSAGSYAALTHSPARAPAAPQPVADHGRQSEAAALTPPVQTPRPPAPSEPPAVRTRVATETYAVRGETAQDVLASMVADGPRSGGDVFFGRTVAEISFRHDARPGPGGCVLTGVEVDLRLTITLPEWTPAPEPSLARDWARFRRALAAHEDEHRRIAEAGAQAMARSLGGLRRGSCQAVEAEARRRLADLEASASQAQRRYDDETDHGRTEGAVWPRGAAGLGVGEVR